jgi:biopolymer transport protein ExbD
MASRNQGAAQDLAPTPSSGGVTSINVTPLLDVLLVLLLIGVVSIAMSRRSLPVALPPEATSGPVLAPIVLELPAGGGYQLNGQPIPPGQLSDLLGAVLRARPAKIVFIKTAGDRSYQDFISASDLARGAGAVTIAVVGETQGSR